MFVPTYLLALLCMGLQTYGSSVLIGLEANWTSPDFAVQLLEAASLYNDSLYYLAATILFQTTDNESEWDEEFDEGSVIYESLSEWPLTDHQCYVKLVSGLTDIDKGFIDLNLANDLASPRIEAHFNYFRNEVQPSLLLQVQRTCQKDSFGLAIADPTKVWVQYGSKIYCSEEDLYALQLSSHSETPREFDRVIGHNKEAPLLVLYGQPSSNRFAGMFNTLAQFANAGNLRFVWRYLPESETKIPLHGFGVKLNVKENAGAETKKLGKVSNFKSFLEKNKNAPIRELSNDEFLDVSIKATALTLKTSAGDQLSVIAKFINKLPIYALNLARSTLGFSTDDVKNSAARNENIGASSDLVGISINGATIHRLETDLPFIIKKLQAEVGLVKDMVSLGFSAIQAKFLFSKFALWSAIKEHDYRTGSKFNRFAVYKELYNPMDASSGGVVFFNDIEKDSTFDLFSSNTYEVYIEKANQIKQGQVPPLKQNVHDLIFVVNFSDRDQLRVFFAMSKIILDKGIPQQIGILPLSTTKKDEKIATLFYHLLEVGELEEAMALLYKFLNSSEENEGEYLDLVKLQEEDSEKYENYKTTLQKFDLSEPSVIINGVIHKLRSSNWQTKLTEQISSDVKYLKAQINSHLHENLQLKDVLHASSRGSRNSKVVPETPANLRYKKLSLNLLQNSYSLQTTNSKNRFGPTFWLIGDFDSERILSQFKAILKFAKTKANLPLQIRIFHTGLSNQFVEDTLGNFIGTSLENSHIDQILELIGDFRIQTILQPDEAKLKILRDNRIQLHHPALLLNSRYHKLDRVFLEEDLALLVEYEYNQRLEFLEQMATRHPDRFEGALEEIVGNDIDHLTWFDMATSVLSASIFLEDSKVRSDFGRFDFSSLNFDNLIDLTGYDVAKPADILIVIDPLDVLSQKLISVATALKDLPFVNMLVLLQPLSTVPKEVNTNCLYVSNFVGSKPVFDIEGTLVRSQHRNFHYDHHTTISVQLDTPQNWVVTKSSGSDTYDVENLTVDGSVVVKFELVKLVVETEVKDVSSARPLTGLALEAVQFDTHHEGITVQPGGYCQLSLEPGTWEYRIKTSNSKGTSFNLLSVSENPYEINDAALEHVPLLVFSLFEKSVHARIKMNSDSAKSATSKSKLPAKKPQSTLNVFCVANGHTQEEFLASLIISITQNSSQNVKIWLIETFLSKRILSQLPSLSEKFKFDYELISYQWPLWLRKQRETSRQLLGYKALFLDMLFPEDLEKLIVIDADLIVTSDLAELTKIDLNGATYGFVPICEDKPVSQKFWHDGYWKKVLADDLSYYSSSLFVVDLTKFRSVGAGNLIRRQYQKLSSDLQSLTILDENLFNNLQRVLPIYSLPREWSWNPIWCSGDDKIGARVLHFNIHDLNDLAAFKYAKSIAPAWKPSLGFSHSPSKSPKVVHDEF
ncbi:hypothetical protein PUMCH_002199 [Australozyma saopauloensis]|uniref:UDP-glucose:glycoprotein glucosyltransferase n=1 Tax=Australozyma saopauloensis TaxID=291208 RepID=A0AAX4HAX7_9ASCO|nr:hypothetical protein PUMCH_002199 [[Candida] saopauloensis]